MPRINIKFLLFFFLLVIVVCLVSFLVKDKLLSSRSSNEESYLIINGQKISIELADTPGKRTQGLSGRESLAENKGMLFVFPQPGNYGFWMKGMKFDLDFVFIREGKVVDLIENVPCPKENQPPQTVNSKAQFDWALEVNTGMAKKFNFAIGDQVELK